MSRRRHPERDVEIVLRELERRGWTVELRGGGHAWGLLRCAWNSGACRDGRCCQMSVNSTPENPGNHAARLRGKALACIYADGDGGGDGRHG